MSSAISLPFSFNANGGVSYTSDLTKIIQDRIVLAVMSSVDERIMRPNYGTYIRGATFENLTSAVNIVRQEITSTFSEWFSYLTLLSVDASTDENYNLNISITYKNGASLNPDTISIKTALLTRSGTVITEVPYGQQ
jgi:phage baseplate assembly protein W